MIPHIGDVVVFNDAVVGCDSLIGVRYYISSPDGRRRPGFFFAL